MLFVASILSMQCYIVGARPQLSPCSY